MDTRNRKNIYPFDFKFLRGFRFSFSIFLKSYKFQIYKKINQCNHYLYIMKEKI